MQISDAKEIVLAIPDLQAPFEHRDALPFVISVKRKYRPTKVVIIGDEADKHALSDYPVDPDGMSAGLELHNCVEHLKPWYKAFPEAVVCISNHTERIFRKAYKHGIPRKYLKGYNEFLDAPDSWRWGSHWIIDGVRYEHGHSMGGGGRTAGYNLPLLNRMSTVFGHFHGNAGIVYLCSDSVGLQFGFNVGCLIDMTAYAFKYGALVKNKPILGCGIIRFGVPYFIPMILNKGNRWIREIL